MIPDPWRATQPDRRLSACLSLRLLVCLIVRINQASESMRGLVDIVTIDDVKRVRDLLPPPFLT